VPPSQTPDRLLRRVEVLRARVAAVELPLDVERVASARREQTALLAQVDDYLLPRLRALDAPLLAVVGGSTGAGKSTLVNSVLGRVVTRSGVLRPTTRSPVLVHHPEDTAWFDGGRVLPSLARVTGDVTAADDDLAPITAVQLVAGDALPPGLALLDAPDIDSVVSANRELAQQLLAAADLWLFVTTAARYADAVPWDLLRGAAERGAAVAIVLDRVPPEAMDEVRLHLASMLRERGLASAPLFTIAESAVTGGLLAADVVAPVRAWLTALAKDSAARQVVVRRTLGGALDAVRPRTATLVDAVAAQDEARSTLALAASESYTRAARRVREGLADGSLLRGEVLARWQEFVGTGELLRSLEVRVGRLRDRVTAAVRGRPAPTSGQLGAALQTGVQALITAQVEAAAEDTALRWRQVPGGVRLVATHPGLAARRPDLPDVVARTVRDWQGYLLTLVSDEGADKRTTARVLSYGVNGTGVLLMLVVFSQTAGLSGAEVGIAGGTAVLAQRLLEAVFGDQAVRELAAKAKADLARRADALLVADRERFDAVLAELTTGTSAKDLAHAASDVEAAR
jgi:hypothetical protein